MRAIRANSPGGPEVLEVVDLPEPAPGPGELLVRVAAAGVNFIDTYRRSGVYPMPFPHLVGSEGAGTVAAVGDRVAGVAVGDRVAWFDGCQGAYAELAIVSAGRAVPVPEAVSLETAAAVMLQGATAHYLVDSTFPVQRGQVVLVHAGAGGVGQLLIQLVVARGARVITTVSTDEKAALARAAGAADVIRYDQLDDLTAELPTLVRELSGGGVHTVFDGVGKATFDASLASLRPRGGLALFGGASGQVPPFDPQRLNSAGSVYLTRPTLGHYSATPEELRHRTDVLFAALADGELRVRYTGHPLAEAAEVHRALEGRQTTGKLILVP